jgi:hypothetical protein
MKIGRVIAAACGAALFAGFLHAADGIVGRHGQLSVKGTQIVDARAVTAPCARSC